MLHEWLAECVKAIVANPSDTIKGDQAFGIGHFLQRCWTGPDFEVNLSKVVET
jgi:hypothetical protein